MLEIISVCIGGAGFLLSIGHIVVSLCRNKVKFSASEIVYTSMKLPNGQVSTYVRMCLTNLSHRPVAITSSGLIVGKNIELKCSRPVKLYLAYGSKVKRARTWTTTLPINLSPQESRDILLSFPVPVERLQEFHLPPADNLPKFSRMQSDIAPQDQQESNQLLPICLRFYTPRGSIRLPIKASVGSVDADMAVLKKAANLGFDE